MDIEGCLVVRDSDGVARIVLSAFSHGGGFASVSIGAEGEAQMVLEAGGDRGRIRFERGDGTTVAVIAGSETGISVTAFDTQGSPICATVIDTDARLGFLATIDSAGRVGKKHEIPLS